MRSMHHWLMLTAAGMLAGAAFADPAPVLRARTPIHIPDVPGFVTLKCDLHIHTVFSDGGVWPSIRAEEAWREGLDAIALTDHLEYQPHAADVATNHNRSFEIAKPAGDELDIIVIRGSEITRGMPPGHINAIFLTNSEALSTTNWHDAIQEAHAQGAFIFWNHPGWDAQQPDGVARWYPEHTELLEAGMLHGVEVVNERSYYPESHAWCAEKHLAMLSNSDIHNPIHLDYDVREGDARPMTLVFARERSADAIKEALFARRTAVLSGDRLIGAEEYLRPIVSASIEVVHGTLNVHGRDRAQAQLTNRSDIPFTLVRRGDVDGFSLPKTLTIPAGKTVLLSVQAKRETPAGRHDLLIPFEVSNALIAPDTRLHLDLPLTVTSAP
ncbi:MAG: histidinol-phosphatase [Lentisphaerae bacterium]|nr:histidinol-phosphatase [Lentisphaerota bacterium]